MRSRLFLFALICGCCLMAACSRDYDVDLPAHQSELVVECYLEDGQPLRAIVTESTALLDTSLVPPVVLDAVVSISYGGRTDTLLPFIYLDSARNRIYNYGSNTVVKAQYGSGAVYRIDVVDKSGRHAFGTTRFIPPVPISNISAEFNDDGEASMNTSFADNPGQKNYYRLVLMRNSRQDSIQQNRLFSDELANNVGEIVVRSRNRYRAGDSLHATLFHLDADFYQYLNTSQNAGSALVNPFAASGEVISNIQGGRGVFAALSYATKSIRVE